MPSERRSEPRFRTLDPNGDPAVTRRPTASEINDDQLDALYEELNEARMWARHGYEIGQKHCSWSDHGVAPAWLTEGWPPHFDSCEHLQHAAQYDEAVSRARALAVANQTEGENGEPVDADTLWPSEVLAALDGPDQPAPDGGPTVAEATANDRRWDLGSAGE